MKLKSAIIELNNSCTWCLCNYCSANSILYLSNKKLVISEEVLKSVIKDLIDLGVNEIEISGGEPFTTPKQLELALSEFLEHGVRVKIFTNLYINDLTFFQSKYSEILKLIIKGNELVEIHFPLNTLDLHKMKMFIRNDITINFIGKDRIYNLLINYLNTILRNMCILLEYEVPLGIHFLITKINYLDFPNIVEFAETYGIKYVSFLRLVKHGRAVKYWNELTLSEKDWFEFFRKLEWYLLDYNKNVVLRFGCPINWFFLLRPVTVTEKIMSNPNIKLGFKCVGGVEHICITPDLSIYPCVGAKGIEKLKLCNLTEVTKLHDVFGVKKYEEYLRLREEMISDECRKCRYFIKGLCDSKCLVQKLTNPNPFDNKRDIICTVLEND